MIPPQVMMMGAKALGGVKDKLLAVAAPAAAQIELEAPPARKSRRKLFSTHDFNIDPLMTKKGETL